MQLVTKSFPSKDWSGTGSVKSEREKLPSHMKASQSCLLQLPIDLCEKFSAGVIFWVFVSAKDWSWQGRVRSGMLENLLISTFRLSPFAQQQKLSHSSWIRRVLADSSFGDLVTLLNIFSDIIFAQRHLDLLLFTSTDHNWQGCNAATIIRIIKNCYLRQNYHRMSFRSKIQSNVSCTNMISCKTDSRRVAAILGSVSSTLQSQCTWNLVPGNWPSFVERNTSPKSEGF